MPHLHISWCFCIFCPLLYGRGIDRKRLQKWRHRSWNESNVILFVADKTGQIEAALQVTIWGKNFGQNSTSIKEPEIKVYFDFKEMGWIFLWENTEPEDPRLGDVHWTLSNVQERFSKFFKKNSFSLLPHFHDPAVISARLAAALRFCWDPIPIYNKF